MSPSSELSECISTEQIRREASSCCPLVDLDSADCSNDSIHLQRVHRTPRPLGAVSTSPSILRCSKRIRTNSSMESKERRRVLFSAEIRVEEVTHIEDVPQEELQARWMTAQDYQAIRLSNKQSLQVMTKGRKALNGNFEFCARGLEIRTREGSQKLRQRQQKVLHTVMRAQNFQRAEGFRDPDYIAELCAISTKVSAKEAQAMGERDAQAVRA
eukprot:Nitzschia sp. Nitz4//scaffold31_size150131//64349//64990//NITZ4_002827-RA/size150131-processed-gene-0.196-mRNA-1//1//CDS//3329547656//3616//frame0